jgi:hypothetical protein
MADLTITLTESLILNGKEQGASKSTNIGACTDVYKRTFTLDTNTATTIAEFKADVSTSQQALDLEGVKYLRVTNLHGSTDVGLTLVISNDEDGAGDHATTILLNPEMHFVMGELHDSIATSDSSTAHVEVGSLVDLQSIVVKCASAAQIEIFVAGVIA